MSFVRVRDGALELDGAPFSFLLMNAFYLQEEAARGRLDRVDEVLLACRCAGARVVRTWAFNDDPNKEDSGIQRGRLAYREEGLTGLDRVIERAGAHGLKLILPLVNYWNAYGGARQWLLWNGIADACEGDARFFTDGRVRDHYARHLEQILRRKNPFTGLLYAEDETVLAWELMNEPRGRGLDQEGKLLSEWVAFAAHTVKRLAPAQLVCVGDEGEEVSFDGYDARFWSRVRGAHLFAGETGASFSRHLACAEVDLASCHFYPEMYGIAAGADEEAGIAWIEEHARIAHAARKPLVVGEFGLRSERSPRARHRASERAAIYLKWLSACERAKVAGAGPWLLAHRDRSAEWDEFTLYESDLSFTRPTG